MDTQDSEADRHPCQGSEKVLQQCSVAGVSREVTQRDGTRGRRPTGFSGEAELMQNMCKCAQEFTRWLLGEEPGESTWPSAAGEVGIQGSSAQDGS